MKTLNKTLSLVLVLVMVLGVFGVASAKEFTDADAVTYTEAVDVMIGIGVIDGYDEDNTIRPTATVTREEAAKMIAYAVLGKNVADNLATGATGFTDVSANRWSAPYISYLVGRGIINGMGDGTFAPTASVTGYQFAKMMLCAVGYGAKGEYTGSSWQLNVAVDANKYDINENAVGVDYTAPATREEAMLYAFNGIQVGQVEYNKVFDTYLGKGQGIQNAKGPSIADEVYPKLVHRTARNAAGNIITTAMASTSVPVTGFDSFGNPADVWTFNGKTIGAYVASPAATFTEDLDNIDGRAAVAKALKGYNMGSVEVVVNGALTPAAPVTTNAVAAMTGNGTEVYVYANGNTVIRIVVINTVLAKVTYVDTAKETITLSFVQAGAGYGALAIGTLSTGVGYGKVAKDDYVVVATQDTDSSGDISGDASVLSVAPTTVVEGLATAKSGYSNTITVGGKAYKLAAGISAVDSFANFEVTESSEATLVLDGYGYILKAVSGASVVSDNLIALTDYYVTTVNGKNVNMVEGYSSKGEKINLAVTAAKTISDVGDIFYYTESARAGVYNLTTAVPAWTDSGYAPEDVARNTTTPYVYTVVGDSINEYDKYDSVTYSSSSHNYYYATDVKFIFAEQDTTPPHTNSKVTVLNGVQKVTSKESSYVLGRKGNTYEIVAVFVKGAPETTANLASDLYFIAAHNGTMVKDGKTYYSLLAVNNGSLVADCYCENFASASSRPTVGGFYTASKDAATGMYTFASYTNFNTPGNNLRVAWATVVTNANVDGTIITTAGSSDQSAPGVTLDISKAPIVNLDTQQLADAATIRASYDRWVANGGGSAANNKEACVGVIYNEKNVASMVFFFEKNVIGA